MGSYVSYMYYGGEAVQNQNQVLYARMIPGTEEPGYSQHLVSVHNKDENDFKVIPYPGIDTIWRAFKMQVQRIPDEPWLGSRNFKDDPAGPYEWKTWRKVDEMVEDCAKGMQRLQMLPLIENEGNWKFMGILSKNRWEWTVTELASVRQGGTTVAFYDTLGPESVEFIINQTKLTTIACAGQYVDSLIKLKSTGKVKTLKNIVTFDNYSINQFQTAQAVKLNLISLGEVIQLGQNVETAEFTEPEASSIYMFCYTSGTTGDPKAVKISHQNCLSVATCVNYAGVEVYADDTVISYLPLAHSFEKVLFTLCLVKGVRIGYYGGDVLKLTDDCIALKPTFFPSVPRLYNRIYDKINAKLGELSGARGFIANRAINSKLYYLNTQGTLNYAFYDRVVCSKFKAILGGQVRFMVTGSAPISVDVVNFLKVCFCCPLLEGYGQTECCAAATISLPEDQQAGHVGGPLPCVKLRLADLPEMEYMTTDKPFPRGEICFKGPSVTPGYYKDDEKTLQTIQDGWLRTGDVGMILPNGCIKIIDRAKNIFKLSQGEYIAPEKLEGVYGQSPYIQEIFVHGDSLQSVLVSVVVPDFEAVVAWDQKKVNPAGYTLENTYQICDSSEVQELILKSMNQLAQDNKFNGLEKPKRVFLCAQEFVKENADMITPSFKLKRNAAAKHFRAQIDTMYASLSQLL